MPTITMIQPKGGTGKSTTTLLLATEFAEVATVTVIDTDPNAPILAWQERGGTAPNLDVVHHKDEMTLIEAIEDAAARSVFVIVDTEGTANYGAAKAAAVADLVVIPSQGSTLDLDNAAKAIRIVRNEERSGRKIPHAILFNRVSPAIRTKGMKAAEEQIAKHGIDAFRTALVEREAFRAMFAMGQPLSALTEKDVSGVTKARANSKALAAEAVERIKAGQGALEKRVA